MLNRHLSDEQIQELATGNTGMAKDILAHAENCADCQMKLQNYRLLLHAVEEQPAQTFDFDLAAMVVAQIETAPSKTITKGLWWLCAVTILAILTGTVIYFGDYVITMAKEFKSLVYYFIAISGLVLIIMLLIDQYKTYNRKMKILDMP